MDLEILIKNDAKIVLIAEKIPSNGICEPLDVMFSVEVVLMETQNARGLASDRTSERTYALLLT